MTGTHTCFANFVTVAGTAGQITLGAESYVENTSPLHPGSQDTREPGHTVLHIGQTLDVAVDDSFTIPDVGKPIAISGDVLWTACRDADDEIGCPAGVYTDTATLQTWVAVFQRGSAGQEWCHQWTATPAPVSSTINGQTTHHSVVYGGGTFVPNPSCGTSARVKIWVKHAGGDGKPLAIHANGTITAAMPTP